MGHYIADGIFLLLGLITVIICAKRGILLTLLKAFRLVISILLAYFFAGKIGQILNEKLLFKPIWNFVYSKVNGVYTELAADFNVNAVIAKFPKFLIPESLKEELSGIEATGENLVNSFTDSIANTASSLISKVLAAILIFFVSLFFIGVIYKVIKNIKKKTKAFSFIDSLLGAVFGFAFAWIILLIIGSAIKFFFAEAEFYTQSMVVKFFAESSLLDSIKMLNVNGWMNKWLEA